MSESDAQFGGIYIFIPFMLIQCPSKINFNTIIKTFLILTYTVLIRNIPYRTPKVFYIYYSNQELNSSMSQTNSTPSASESSAPKMPNADEVLSETTEMSNMFSSLSSSLSSSSSTSAEVKVGMYYDEWARCVGSSYQIDHLYRLGRFDSCKKQWGDVKTAVKIKFTRDPKKAQELLDSTYFKKRTTISPTAGAIWELKERPGWD